MIKDRLPEDELPAYTLAARAVLAHRYRIAVRRISLPYPARKYRLWLPRLEEACQLRNPHTLRAIDQIENYVAVLMAGSVGKLLRLEYKFGLVSPCVGRVQLERKCFEIARKCHAPDTERALVITLGWLRGSDNGNSIATIERLWRRVNRILRTPSHRAQLVSLAEHLKLVREMTADQVTAFFA